MDSKTLQKLLTTLIESEICYLRTNLRCTKRIRNAGSRKVPVWVLAE